MFPLTLSLLSACGGPALDSAPTPGGFDGDIRGGDYQFFTSAAADACLDGALEALFMPSGPQTPHAFSYPVYVPAYDELPLTYDVDFREPFVGMTVTVEERAGGGLMFAGSVMEAVALGDAYGDCVVTMVVDAELTPLSAASFEGASVIGVSDARGSEGLCPVFEADPCEVSLALEAERL